MHARKQGFTSGREAPCPACMHAMPCVLAWLPPAVVRRLLPMLSTPRAAAPCVACRDAEVEVLCAAMRAGCVMVALELQVPGAAASSGVESGRSKGGAGAAAAAGVLCSRDGSGKGGSSLGDLPQALAAAVRQWLLHTNLEAELQPGMPVVMQVRRGKGAAWLGGCVCGCGWWMCVWVCVYMHS